LKLLTPPLNEQTKIAEIITSVDDVIELTEKEIEKLQMLKKGMMQDLLTKGIGQTKFKDSPVGQIPEGWEVLELGQVTKRCAFWSPVSLNGI
jgi:type I restriction enzyme S subunit